MHNTRAHCPTTHMLPKMGVDVYECIYALPSTLKSSFTFLEHEPYQTINSHKIKFFKSSLARDLYFLKTIK